ncbi:MAG TPA: AAA family ATPase [Chitinophagaceae bacterium]|nr:AAA family ATPase [Chitinophagaceae bacterium]
MGVKKIVIIGPESTGKSTLCFELAKHYNTLWCPEFAREYLLMHGKKYSYADLLIIAKEQLRSEDEYSENVSSELLFIDTDMYVMKVWCEFVYNKCHPFILQQIAERKYDLYLLCNVDLPWVADELREYPDLEIRKKIYSMYKDIMITQSVTWKEISGKYDERLKSAIDAVEEVILQ